MTRQKFQAKIKSKFRDIPVEFHHFGGRHLAVVADEGITISANTKSNRITVTWGAGHCAMGTL